MRPREIAAPGRDRFANARPLRDKPELRGDADLLSARWPIAFPLRRIARRQSNDRPAATDLGYAVDLPPGRPRWILTSPRGFRFQKPGPGRPPCRDHLEISSTRRGTHRPPA